MKIKQKKTKVLKRDGYYLMWVPPLGSFLKIPILKPKELLVIVDNFFFNLNKDKKTIKFEDFVTYILEVIVAPNLTEEELKTITVNDKGKIQVYTYLATTIYPELVIDQLLEHINAGMLENLEVGKVKSEYNLVTFNDLEKEFKKQIIGQDEAISEIIKLLKVKVTGFSNHISLFFLGSTGVGKTELSRAIARIFYKSQDKLIKINCGEYTSKHEQNRLFGSPPGYIGSDEDSFLLQLAKKSNEYIFLFDEIEKSNDNLYEALLGLLDDGHIKDNKSNQLDFSKSIFIFTSNVGVKENLYKTEIGFNKTKNETGFKDSLMLSLKEKFTPEFLNRMDSIVCFNFLSKENIKTITRLNLSVYPIEVTEELVEYIVSKAYSEEYGAREINRFIKKEILVLMAESMLKEGKSRDSYTPEFKEGLLVSML
jgi:ATP-dependent Clp protease ATP-binding subunit ClpA